jgi:hypothetical protein
VITKFCYIIIGVFFVLNWEKGLNLLIFGKISLKLLIWEVKMLVQVRIFGENA